MNPLTILIGKNSRSKCFSPIFRNPPKKKHNNDLHIFTQNKILLKRSKLIFEFILYILLDFQFVLTYRVFKKRHHILYHVQKVNCLLQTLTKRSTFAMNKIMLIKKIIKIKLKWFMFVSYLFFRHNECSVGLAVHFDLNQTI